MSGKLPAILFSMSILLKLRLFLSLLEHIKGREQQKEKLSEKGRRKLLKEKGFKCFHVLLAPSLRVLLPDLEHGNKIPCPVAFPS